MNVFIIIKQKLNLKILKQNFFTKFLKSHIYFGKKPIFDLTKYSHARLFGSLGTDMYNFLELHKFSYFCDKFQFF